MGAGTTVLVAEAAGAVEGAAGVVVETAGVGAAAGVAGAGVATGGAGVVIVRSAFEDFYMRNAGYLGS